MKLLMGKRLCGFFSCLVFVLSILFFASTAYAQEYKFGSIPLDPQVYKKYLKIYPRVLAEDLPLTYDARNDGIVTPAKNQGSCGACYAFASVGAMESHLLKTYQVGPEDLSEQQLVSCPPDSNGCRGGRSTRIRYWETKGPLYESCFPYTATDTIPCGEPGCEQLPYRVINWHTVNQTEIDFKTSLYEYGPSWWNFGVYGDFTTFWNRYNPGAVYINRSSTYMGGHAVLLIGWDDGKGAYLCKNSWGGGGPNGDGTFWMAYSGHSNYMYFSMVNFNLIAIGQPTITVTSPNGGEQLVAGELHEITWTSEGDFADIGIEFSVNNGTEWIQISDSAENDGSYTWIVPNNPSEECLVRISDIDDDPFDVSDAVFSILPRFSDVPPGYWAEEAIYKIYKAGITTCCSTNPLMYCPLRNVTRAQMAIFLGRAKHGTGFTPPDATGIFADVSLDHWAADWIEQAYDDGITKGCSTNPLRYCPEVNVNRAQMAAFLLTAKHGGSYTPPDATGIFSDVDLNHWAADWIEQLYNEGITVGCGTNPLRYCPGTSVTRAQMAVFIMRTFDL